MVGGSRDNMVGGVCKVIFMSNPTVMLSLGWGFDNVSAPKNYTEMVAEILSKNPV